MKMDMVLTPKAVSLKEVTVKPDSLRQKGDTLSHNLASFLGKGGDDEGGKVTPVTPE